MDVYIILLRIIHIGSAILWFGGAVFYSAFVGPAVGRMGPQGSRFFGLLVRQGKAVVFFVVVSTTTVIAGGFLYWRDSGGFDPDWMRSDFGTGLTVGAVAGLISWLLVLLVLAPTSYKLTSLGERVTASGGSPSGEEIGALETLRARLNRFALVNIASLTIATVAMASARYLNF